ncbi:MAG: N-acetylmuramidase family protein [Blastomonas fulva]|uniref:N-acetylmuramidase family protein n=1 Tax=Blastomonas fulva TaxID=1550728 RepID=UPI004033C9CF
MANASTAPFRQPVFAAIKSLRNDRAFTPSEVVSIDRLLDALEVPTTAGRQIGLTSEDFAAAASRLGCTVAQIRAVWDVESGGGWFTDVRSDILALDGPGGFIDGPHLPKILFEAHVFDRYTDGKFRASHPNLSSARWDRKLYIGGAAEWTRLHRAMQLDRRAALLSASVGGAQIMGFNHQLAGFDAVEDFWEAMKVSERAHLAAFSNFILAKKLGPALRQISNRAIDCQPFARGYNGAGFAANRYDEKIAAAHAKFSRGSA